VAAAVLCGGEQEVTGILVDVSALGHGEGRRRDAAIGRVEEAAGASVEAEQPALVKGGPQVHVRRPDLKLDEGAEPTQFVGATRGLKGVLDDDYV
jgi:hypothetical protein